jgi:hypothetical protein
MRSHHALALVLSAAFAAVLAACGGGSADDPRCVSLCTIKQPPIDGAGDICSQASADQCKQECGAHIDGVPTACADCLLQDAQFGGGTSSGGGDECHNDAKCPETTLCTETGNGTSCEYCEGDKTAEDNCYKQLHPRREVDCTASFRDPAKCSAVCAPSK